MKLTNYLWLGAILAVTSVAISSCTGKVNNPDRKDVATCVIIEPGISPVALAQINQSLGSSKQFLEPGIFEQKITLFYDKNLNIIPDQETVCAKEISKVNNFDVLELTPAKIKDASTVILYTHGGAYLFGMSNEQIQTVDKLANDLGMKAYMPSYPLIPHVEFQVAHDMVRKLYLQLVESGKKVIVMGDSAGGGFTLALAEYLHSQNLTMPTRMVLLSPWLDVTMSNPEIAGFDEVDVSLASYGLKECGKLWTGTENLDDIRKNTQVCPLNGDLAGMPPTLLIVGTAEVMCPDVTLLYEKLKAQETPVRLIYGKNLFHVFPIYFKDLDLPAANQALNEIEIFLKEEADFK